MKQTKQQFKDLSIMDKLFVILMTSCVGIAVLMIINLVFNI